MSTPRTALHIIHGYNEPFCRCPINTVARLQSDGWRVITVYLSGKPDTAKRQNTVADAAIF